MAFGSIFLLGFSAGFVVLFSLRIEWTTEEGRAVRAGRLPIYRWIMHGSRSEPLLFVGDAKMMNSETQPSRLPNGPAAAALLACGVGVCTFGVLVVLGEARPDLVGALNLIDAVGPLSD